MSEATLQIRPEIEILFYFPFNLGFSTAHVAPTEQGPLFQKIADKLNHGYADYEWSSVPYPSLPGTIERTESTSVPGGSSRMSCGR